MSSQKEIDRIPIPGGLNKNSQIVIRGRVPFNSCRFAINLKTGEEDDADIAFHFNPRNDGDVVVHNTRISGEWGEEERWSKRCVTLAQFLWTVCHPLIFMCW